MDITLLVESFLGLTALLGFLIVYLLYSGRDKKATKVKKVGVGVKKKKVEKPLEETTLEELLNIIKSKKSTTDELKTSTELVISKFGKIKEFNKYGDIIMALCRHPNVNKNIITKFDKELSKLNPDHKREINLYLEKGLNSRGF